jgi:hypothetical protein
MDWNENGWTGVGEILVAENISRRPILQDSRRCVEYFRLKDGLPVRVSCASG